MFCDWDPQKKELTGYISASSFFVLAAGAATTEQAERFIKAVLPKLEQLGGLSGSDETSRGPISETRPLRQWDYPFGWAPHMIMACQGLARYGFNQIAERLAYKWLYMITKEALAHGGAVLERYDVVHAQAFPGAEYGAQGLAGIIDGGAGFGWTNASFQILTKYLSQSALSKLTAMTPPREVFSATLESC